MLEQANETAVPSLFPRISVQTSLTSGIKFLLEASETQLVAVDTNKTVKFYDFYSKAQREYEENQAKIEDQVRQHWKVMLAKYDKDQSGTITVDELGAMMQDMVAYFDDTMKLTKEDIQMTMTMIDAD